MSADAVAPKPQPGSRTDLLYDHGIQQPILYTGFRGYGKATAIALSIGYRYHKGFFSKRLLFQFKMHSGFMKTKDVF